MFCSNCGNQVREGAKFCSKCGTPVEAGAPAIQVENVQTVEPVIDTDPVVTAEPVIQPKPVEPVEKAEPVEPVATVATAEPVVQPVPVEPAVSASQTSQPDYDSDKTEILSPYGMPTMPVIPQNELAAPVLNTGINTVNSKTKDKKSSNKTLKGIIIALCVLLLILVIGLVLILRFSDEISYVLYGDSDSDKSEVQNTEISGSHRSDDDDDESEDDEDEDDDEEIIEEDETEDDNEEDENLTADQKDLSDEPPVFQQFYISSKMEENYDNVLDYTRYMRYDSGISEFCFGYPAELFHSVSFEDTMSPEHYGLSEQEIHFSGSSGTELFYSLYRRTDNMNIAKMTEEVHNFESQFIVDPSDVLYTVEADHGTCIIGGYISQSRDYYIYNLNKVVGNYVMQMRVYYPVSSGEKGGYLIDTLYRMCGFSGSTSPARDYNSYLNR